MTADDLPILHEAVYEPEDVRATSRLLIAAYVILAVVALIHVGMIILMMGLLP